jgi:hypothetical protein
MPYISRVHLDDLSWHIAMDSIMLNTREGLVHLLTTMIDMNKVDVHLLAIDAHIIF